MLHLSLHISLHFTALMHSLLQVMLMYIALCVDMYAVEKGVGKSWRSFNGRIHRRWHWHIQYRRELMFACQQW